MLTDLEIKYRVVATPIRCRKSKRHSCFALFSMSQAKIYRYWRISGSAPSLDIEYDTHTQWGHCNIDNNFFFEFQWRHWWQKFSSANRDSGFSIYFLWPSPWDWRKLRTWNSMNWSSQLVTADKWIMQFIWCQESSVSVRKRGFVQTHWRVAFLLRRARKNQPSSYFNNNSTYLLPISTSIWNGRWWLLQLVIFIQLYF